jgi:hypothetical protein
LFYSTPCFPEDTECLRMLCRSAVQDMAIAWRSDVPRNNPSGEEHERQERRHEKDRPFTIPLHSVPKGGNSFIQVRHNRGSHAVDSSYFTTILAYTQSSRKCPVHPTPLRTANEALMARRSFTRTERHNGALAVALRRQHAPVTRNIS